MKNQRGFSLIEMLVAMVILSLSLGVLYQTSIGATRNVAVASEYSEAVIIAESMLSRFEAVSEPGIQGSGQIGAFDWQVDARIRLTDQPDSSVLAGELADIGVTVSWDGGARRRTFSLSSVVPIVGVPE